jgi:hypothetical protein
MTRRRQAQVNVRSDALKARIEEVTARTGMSATRFLEEAAARFEPAPEELPPGLKRVNGWLIVAPGDGRTFTLEQTNAWIEEDRASRGDVRS